MANVTEFASGAIAAVAEAVDEDATPTWGDPAVNAAIGISIGAGLATAIGGALVFFPEMMKKIPQNVVLAVSLALSAGVMLYVSFIEIFGKSFDSIMTNGGEAECGAETCMEEGPAAAITTVCFFAGMMICVLLEFIVHKMSGDVHGDPTPPPARAGADATDSTTDAPSPPPSPPEGAEAGEVKVAVVGEEGKAVVDDGTLTGAVGEGDSLGRMGLMTALAIAIHNFPEGLATFLATVDEVSVGASLGVAIAIHNIPEGLCVAMPIYYATGDKWKAFRWSLYSGITEPIGGLLGFAVLQPVFTDMVFGIVFAMVGGMMIFIVLHELLPAAHRYMNDSAKVTMWLMIGMIIMAISLVLFVL